MASADSGNTEHGPGRQRLTLEFQTTGCNGSPVNTSDSLGSAGPHNWSISSELDVTPVAADHAPTLFIPKLVLNTRCLSRARLKFGNWGSLGTRRPAQGGERRCDGVTGDFTHGVATAPELQSFLKTLINIVGAGWERMLISI